MSRKRTPRKKKAEPAAYAFKFIETCTSRPAYDVIAPDLAGAAEDYVFRRDHEVDGPDHETVEDQGLAEIYKDGAPVPPGEWPASLTPHGVDAPHRVYIVFHGAHKAEAFEYASLRELNAFLDGLQAAQGWEDFTQFDRKEDAEAFLKTGGDDDGDEKEAPE